MRDYVHHREIFPAGSARLWDGLEQQTMNFSSWRAFGKVEHFDAHHLIVFIVIDDDPRRHFLGPARGCVGQTADLYGSKAPPRVKP